MKTVYEDVVKQPADKLAQTMQDMTYCWNETVVPKKHYKKLLTKQLEEVVADSVSVSMVSAYYKTLVEFNKGNREWYVSALLCIELGINPSKASQQELEAVNRATLAALAGPDGGLLAPDLKAVFDQAMLGA
ncbi:hypothetical protein [Lacticaseibacillus suihuaensis]